MNSKLVENTTFCIVLFTNIFIGLTTKSLLKCLKIQIGGEEQLNVRDIDDTEYVFDEEINEDEGCWDKFQRWVVRIDENYLIRCLEVKHI